MQLSLRPRVCPQLRLAEMLTLAAHAGFSAIELCRDGVASSPVHSDLSVRCARELIQASGLAVTGFEIRDLTGRKADSDERNLAYNLSQLEWDIHLARALGIRQIQVAGGARTDEAREDLIAGLQQLLERVPDVTLNLVSRPGSCLQCLAGYQAVLAGLDPRVRALLDTGALLAAGEDVLTVAEGLAGRIGAVRLDPNAPNLPFAALFDLLKRSGYDGAVIVDLPPSADPLTAAIAAREIGRLERTTCGSDQMAGV